MYLLLIIAPKNVSVTIPGHLQGANKFHRQIQLIWLAYVEETEFIHECLNIINIKLFKSLVSVYG